MISRENVEAMISIIGKPEDFDNVSEPDRSGTNIFPSALWPEKNVYRNPDDKIISGVCGGLGSYLNMRQYGSDYYLFFSPAFSL